MNVREDVNTNNVIVKETKKPLEWWHNFVEKESDNELIQKFVEMLEKAGEMSSVKKIDKALEQINSNKNLTESEKDKFNKYGKVLRNRSERQVGENLGLYIKHLRESNGYSLGRLGELTGISGSYIQRIEKGERKAPSLPILEKLAEALHVSTDVLLQVTGASKVSEGSEDVNTTVDFYTLMLSNSVSFGDNKELSKNQKDKLIEIIKLIVDSKWNDKTKSLDLAKLITAVDQFKN